MSSVGMVSRRVLASINTLHHVIFYMTCYSLYMYFIQDEWPQRLTSEGALDLQSETLLLGSHEDIAAILRESARILSIFICMTV